MPELSPTQLQQLRQLLDEVDGANPFWTARLHQAGVTAQSLNSLKDLRRLPILMKAELVADQAANPPYGSNLTYAPQAYVRFHQTSGTTGRPMPWLDTAASWDRLCRCWGQIYELAGCRTGDVVAVPFSFGPFIGFWGAFEAAPQAGMRALPMGGMSSEQRLRMLREHAATVVCGTPTYMLRLAEVAERGGDDLRGTAVRTLIVAGEPGGNVPAVRQRLEEVWDARVIDHWGMTDVGALGVEPADAPGGLVLLEEDCVAEILDPDTGRDTQDGETGELIITNLTRAGCPVIRYRTGDLVRPRGRHPATGWQWLEGGVLGRGDDMLTIRGMNVFPSAVESIVRESAGVAEFRLRVTQRQSMDHLIVEVEPAAAADAESLCVEVARRLHDRLHFRAEVRPVAELPRFELKAKRLVRE